MYAYRRPMVRVLLAAIGVTALAACSIPVAPPAGGPSAAPPTAPTSAGATASAGPTYSKPTTAPPHGDKTAKVKATSDGPASLTFTENGKEVRENFSGTWERTVELTESSTTLSLTIESSAEQSSVGCEITSDGTRTRNNSSGSPATVTCRTTIS